MDKSLVFFRARSTRSSPFVGVLARSNPISYAER